MAEQKGSPEGRSKGESVSSHFAQAQEPLLELDTEVSAGLASRAPNEPRSALAALSIFSGIGGLLFGYDTGVISGALPFIKRSFSSVDSSPLLQETVVAAAVAGAVAGAAAGGPLSDFCGRKGALLAGDVFFIAGAVLMAFAPSPLVLIAGRASVGLGIGIASMAVPIYIAEAAPPRVRASLVAVNTLLINVGQFASYIVNFYLSGVPYTWRWMLGIAGVPALIQALGLKPLPESPRWLATQGKIKQAKDAIVKTRLQDEIRTELSELAEIAGVTSISDAGSPSEPTSPSKTAAQDADEGETMQAINDDESSAGKAVTDRTSEQTTMHKSAIQSIKRRPEVRLELGLGLGLQALQQFVGINTVLYYMPIVISWAGLSTRNALAIAVIPAGVNCLFSLLGMLIIDKCGRRRLMLGSLLGCVIGLAIIGGSFTFSAADPVRVLERPVPEDLPGVTACNASETLQTCADCLAHKCGFCHPSRPFWSRQADGFCLTPDSEKGCLDEVSRSFEETETMDFDVDACRSNYGLSSLLGLAVFLATFAPGMAHVPWAVNAEIYPEEMRGVGAAAATTMNWVANLIVTQNFLTLVNGIGAANTFYLFGFFAIAGIVTYSIMLPETGGLTLDEVQEVFKARVERQGGEPLRYTRKR